MDYRKTQDITGWQVSDTGKGKGEKVKILLVMPRGLEQEQNCIRHVAYTHHLGIQETGRRIASSKSISIT